MSNFGLGRVNELLTLYYLNGQVWPDKETENAYNENIKTLTPKDLEQQDGRALAMATEFLKSANKYGWKGVKKVTWTAVNTTALKQVVDPKNKLHIEAKSNPSDIVVEFKRAPQGGSKFLGISAKSATGNKPAGITFKNPGLTTIDSDLKLDLDPYYKKQLGIFVRRYEISPVETQRGIQLKRSKSLTRIASEIGDMILEAIRNKLFKALKTLNNDQLRYHLLSRWLDAEDIYPPYLKVTGEGTKEPYKAKVEDPRNNDKLEKINTGKIQLTATGSNSIAISVGGDKLFSIRLKFKGQKMASSIKLSGEPM